ncbi:MAG: hypothetical protein NVS1B6_03740 [Steroidobacteraceae bacterium]
MRNHPRALWNSHVTGLVLGLVLLLTFLLTGHGLGASGFTTSLAATASEALAPTATAHNDYFGPMFEDGNMPLNAWITWEIIGVAIGAVVAAFRAGRFRWQIDGPPRLKVSARLILAVAGGLLAGFGARVSLGCTSGLGLSGAATLATAGFVFLMGFFLAGLAGGFVLKRYWN